MSRLVELPPIGRVVLVVMLTIVAMALLITLENRARSPVHAAPVVAAADLRPSALDRCRALGEAAVEDAGCHAAWAASRARFFGRE